MRGMPRELLLLQNSVCLCMSLPAVWLTLCLCTLPIMRKISEIMTLSKKKKKKKSFSYHHDDISFIFISLLRKFIGKSTDIQGRSPTSYAACILSCVMASMADHTRGNAHKQNASTIFCALCGISHIYFHAQTAYIRTWQIMAILVAGKTWIPPIWIPCQDKNDAGSGISVVYLWADHINDLYRHLHHLILPFHITFWPMLGQRIDVSSWVYCSLDASMTSNFGSKWTFPMNQILHFHLICSILQCEFSYLWGIMNEWKQVSSLLLDCLGPPFILLTTKIPIRLVFF